MSNECTAPGAAERFGGHIETSPVCRCGERLPYRLKGSGAYVTAALYERWAAVYGQQDARESFERVEHDHHQHA